MNLKNFNFLYKDIIKNILNKGFKMDKEKAEKIAKKINSITEAFSDKLKNADDLIVSSEDLISETDEVILGTENYDVSDIPEILNLQNMVHDIKYIRETLKESSEAGKNLLKSMAAEIEMEPDARMLEAYSHVSSVVTENMKLFLQCYKDISSILLNLSKAQDKRPKQVTNITVEADSEDVKIQNTAELIKQLSELKN